MTILCLVCAVPGAGAAAKKRTVSSELERLRQAGAIAPETAQADRSLYLDARAKVKRLTGTRKAELGGVVAELEQMAARGALAEPTRLPSLFLTLQRNTEYWTTSPLLTPGARLSFPGSELVWQYYPGHGLQIQWLATWGNLNGFWTGGKRYDARAQALLDEAIPLAVNRAGGLAWEYDFAFDGQRPPWVSSLAQGTALQAMAREAVRLNQQPAIFPVAAKGLGIFQTPPPEGVMDAQGDGAHYLQYSGLPKLHILNGFIQSLVGLKDYAAITGDPLGQALFDAGDREARRETPTFDTGAWSLYSRGSQTVESDLSYHNLLRDFLAALCSRTAAIEYCGAAQHFTNYLKIPPAITVLPRVVKAGHTGKLRFKLSKISRVAVSAAGVARDVGVLGRGTKSIAFKAPKKSGAYTLTVTATDLAGNRAQASGALEIRRAK